MSLPAHVTGTPIPTQTIPAGAGVTGSFTVVLAVTIGNGGSVTGINVTQSSGNMTIDQNAMALARSSAYTVGVDGCGGNVANTATVTINYG